MDATDWDSRYAQTDLMWSQGPNQWVEQVAADLPPGTALDLAAGEGRNAIWLAERGWHATAVDFSGVALERATAIAAERLGAGAARFGTLQADLLTYSPEPRSHDLVIVVYLQIVADERARVLRAAASAVAPGGMLVVVAHDTDNLERGYGGPPDPAVLYSAGDVTSDIAGSGLTVERAEQAARVVTTPDGERTALDCLVVATRPRA
ncbi:MAG: class I SAM-dependent methyltransferase [Actinomycetales bacterium]|nr:class I SAM-dependent methyltransferase [Actinomycetales bacterium]